MGNFAALILGISTFSFCVCIYAQNERQSQEVSSTEANRACTNNVTDDTNYMCELDIANVTSSSDVITETEDFNGTTEIVGMESTLSTEVVTTGNETEYGLPVTISTVKSEMETTKYSETTTETIPATTEMVLEAQPVSNEICTCDLSVCICSTFWSEGYFHSVGMQV
jgi:archaellum component FlaF (FlaF/FlaG flagellin family)